MRNINIPAVAVALMLLIVAIALSCVHEIPAPKENTGGNTTPVVPLPGCSSDTVYFEQQVLPVVNTLCGKSGCHGTAQPREFQLIYASKDQSYNAISSRFSSTGRLAEALNDMGEQRISGYTPPSSDQLATLQKWIAQGKKNNSCDGCDTTQFAYGSERRTNI